MSLKFCSFASGSSGNCYLVKSDETAILIDAGISGARILSGLDDTETLRDDVNAILVTHEHIDHVKSLPVMTKRIPDLRVYANEATWDRRRYSYQIRWRHLYRYIKQQIFIYQRLENYKQQNRQVHNYKRQSCIGYYICFCYNGQ